MLGLTPSGSTPQALQAVKILIYNKSRDVDRVCPACMSWYRVGEQGGKEFGSFREFLDREMLEKMEVVGDVGEEQDVS